MLLVAATDTAAMRNPQILVVDDEPDIREAVRGLLQMSIQDADVHTAGSGDEGLSLLRTLEMDLIVSDYKMPGMNGVQFLTEARLLAPHAARILITAFERELADELGPRADVELVFTKPLEPRPLVQACREILGRPRHR